MAGTAISHYLRPRDASAQSTGHVSTIYVPADGLVFRTVDGQLIARLSRGSHGGVLELYGNEEEPTACISVARVHGECKVERNDKGAPTTMRQEATLEDRGAVF
jgi:hypothetical protein